MQQPSHWSPCLQLCFPPIYQHTERRAKCIKGNSSVFSHALSFNFNVFKLAYEAFCDLIPADLPSLIFLLPTPLPFTWILSLHFISLLLPLGLHRCCSQVRHHHLVGACQNEMGILLGRSSDIN